MIISNQLNNNDVINYHIFKYEDEKIVEDNFSKELQYQESHLKTQKSSQQDRKNIDLVNYENRQKKQNINNIILRENTLESLNELKQFNKKVQANAIYKENQEGMKVFFS